MPNLYILLLYDLLKFWQLYLGPSSKYLERIISENNNIELVQLLLKNGADVNLTNQYGATPLHIIVSSNDVESLNLLLKAGSDPNVKDKVFESTPLHFLANSAFVNPVPDEITQMILSLLKHGAKVDLEKVVKPFKNSILWF